MRKKMRNPHVVSLTYRLETSDTVTFDAPPLTHETERFTLRLEEDVLTMKMKVHFASVEAAREAVEHLLTSWEIHVSLTLGRSEISFEYDDAEIIDRNPPESGGTVHLQAHLSGKASASAEVSIHVTRNEYPAPPNDFETSPEVEALLARYHRCLDGEERLIPMANFCYTVLKGTAGGKAEAAKTFDVSRSVLTKHGELTARGDLRAARKWRGEGQNRPLTPAERAWLKAVVRGLILRLGAYNARPSGPFAKIAMADLPPL